MLVATSHCVFLSRSTPSILSLLAQFGKLERSDFSALRLVLFAGEVFPVKSAIEEAQLTQRNWQELRAGVTRLTEVVVERQDLEVRRVVLARAQPAARVPGRAPEHLHGRPLAEQAAVRSGLERNADVKLAAARVEIQHTAPPTAGATRSAFGSKSYRLPSR